MMHRMYSSPGTNIVIVITIVATTLSHSYASNICTSFECDELVLSSVKVITLATMAVASSVLMFRAFKYRSIDHSMIRNKTTFLVVSIASVHITIHNLCNALIGICGPLPSFYTLMFLIFVSAVLGFKSRALWAVEVNDVVDGPKTADRVYNSTIMEDRRFTWVYWTSTAFIICIVYLLDIAEWLFESEALVPLMVGLFGPFIALWFANHERNKRITENHFYKTQILWHIDTVLERV